MAKRKRDMQLNFRVSAEELAVIEQKMSQFGTSNREAYLRKMALDGYVVKLELPELKELVSLMRRSSNNLNQLTRKVHETGRVYKKVDGTPPGEKWRHTTMSVPEMADLLGLKSGTAYDLVKRGYFETTLIDRRIRIITSSFEAWYQKQTHYVKISERSNENGIYREA